MESLVSRGGQSGLPEIVKGIQSFALDQNQKLIDLSYKLLAYERDKIVPGEPTAEEKKNYVQALRYLLDALGFTLSSSLAPTQPNETHELEWLSKRLKMSLDSFENPMLEKEADEFLSKHFPG